MGPRIPTTLILLAAAATLQAGSLRVLILTGSNNHDWRATTPVLRSILESGGLCQAVVTESPENLNTDDFARFDVLLSNFNQFGQIPPREVWSARMRDAFIDWIASGRGLVVVHAGSSVFYEWPEFQRLAGARWGSSTSHGKNHSAMVSFPVRHPITEGLFPFRTHDEFWQGTPIDPEAVVIATVIPDPAYGGSGRTEPVALATRLGAGRGFTLLLGHDVAGMNNPGFRQLLRRGVEWAATGAVVRARESQSSNESDHR